MWILTLFFLLLSVAPIHADQETIERSTEAECSVEIKRQGAELWVECSGKKMQYIAYTSKDLGRYWAAEGRAVSFHLPFGPTEEVEIPVAFVVARSKEHDNAKFGIACGLKGEALRTVVLPFDDVIFIYLWDTLLEHFSS